MDTVEIVIGEDGRIEEPRGVRLQIPKARTRQDLTDEERQVRLRAFFAETESVLGDVPVKEVCESDPFITKFKSMGILDERS